MGKPAEHTAADPLQDIHVQALELLTMLKVIRRLVVDDTGEKDHEVALVIKQGLLMAEKLTDDIDRAALGLSKQKREEVTHD